MNVNYLDAVESIVSIDDKSIPSMNIGTEKKKREILKNRRRSFSVTIPVSPKLLSAARANKILCRVENKLATQENKTIFKATPLNKNIFKVNFISGLPKAKSSKACAKELQLSFQNDNNIGEIEQIVALSNINLNGTVVELSKSDKDVFVTPLLLPPPKSKEIASVIKTAKSDIMSALVSNVLTVKRPVQIKPFSFVNKDIEKWKHREEAWKEKVVDQKFEFKAQPMPVGPPRGIPNRSIKPLTKVKPFHSDLAERATTRKRNHECHRSADGKQKVTVFTFHARPCKVTHIQPFKPVKVHHSPIKCMDINLHTEIRAKERALHAKQKKEIELAIAAEAEKRKRVEEEAAKESLRAFRASLVHKPLQFKKTKPFIIKNSN